MRRAKAASDTQTLEPDNQALKAERDRRRQAEEALAQQVRLVAHLTLLAERGRQAAVLEERIRMAQEIHDTLAQGFAGITTQLEAAEAALAKVPEPALPDSLPAYQAQLGKVQLRIASARDLARESLAEARRSVAALRSPTLEAAPLSEALARFLTQRVLDTAAKSRYVLEGVPHVLPVNIEHCLLRVGQSAIANAVEHAQAQEITVELSFETGQAEMGQVRLRVRDDGRGFDSHLTDAGRFGIIGMRERVEKVRGHLTIVSHPGQGTEVDLTVPISQEEFTTDVEGDVGQDER